MPPQEPCKLSGSTSRNFSRPVENQSRNFRVDWSTEPCSLGGAEMPPQGGGGGVAGPTGGVYGTPAVKCGVRGRRRRYYAYTYSNFLFMSFSSFAPYGITGLPSPPGGGKGALQNFSEKKTLGFNTGIEPSTSHFIYVCGESDVPVLTLTLNCAALLILLEQVARRLGPFNVNERLAGIHAW